ncbi:translation initiation factor IF-2-like [Drosophila biarmipes]|uniref:translation initiation factor IF-2-like n=1 Tax=Drosophila biarmipes TaxID=125945 RepID=UPI0021CC4E76|nr:translation initiation factor IF-2-like [Drosophila biarmipes]
MAGPFATGREGGAAVVGGTGMPTHSEEVADVRAASPPGWLPGWLSEVPLTPRNERSPTRPPSPKGEALPVRSPPPPQPDTPPSPASHGGESPRWKPARPPTPRFERPPAVGAHPRPDTPQYQPGDPVGHHVRTDIPAAHVTHSVRSFVAEGVRWWQDGRLDMAGGPRGEGDGGGAPDLGGDGTSGEPDGSQNPWTAGPMDLADTEYAAIDSRDRAHDTGSDAR